MILGKRIELLECRFLAEPLIVLAEVNGIIKQMTVTEMLESDADFCKVVSGSNLNDLDAVLNHIIGKAIEHVEITN